MACLELDDRILMVDVGPVVPVARTCSASTWCCRTSTTSASAPIGSRPSCSRTGTRITSAPCRTCSASSTDIPVYGTAFTLALLEGKLEEHEVADRCELHVVTPGEGRPPSGRSRCGSCASRTRSRTAWPSSSTRRSGRSCTRATSRSTRRRWTGGRPTCTVSPRRRAGSGVHLLLSDSTNAEEAGLHLERAQRRSGAAAHHREGARTSSWRRASPATSTGSSRS